MCNTTMIDNMVLHMELCAKGIENGVVSPKEAAEDIYLWSMQIKLIESACEKNSGVLSTP